MSLFQQTLRVLKWGIGRWEGLRSFGHVSELTESKSETKRLKAMHKGDNDCDDDDDTLCVQMKINV